MTKRPSWTIIAEWQTKGVAAGRWYTDPELIVTVIDEEREPDGDELAVAVELRYDDEGPYVTGIAIRRHPRAGYQGERTHVAPRDVQRLPLAKIVTAALAFASTHEKPPPRRLSPEAVAAGRTEPSRPFDSRIEVGAAYWIDREPPDERFGPEPVSLVEVRKVLLPRGRPKHGKSIDFYRELSKSYRDFEIRGLSPVKEIARRKRVSENTVHQWVHRMRHELGFLEPSPRSKRKEQKNG